MNAQRPNAGGSFQRSTQGGMPMQGNRPDRLKPVKFDAYRAAGIVYHDIDDVLKRLKIKKDKTLQANVEQAILTYHHRLEEIGLINKDNFDTLNVYMNTVARPMQQGENLDEIQETRAEVRAKIRPVRRSVMQEEKKLNESMTALLDQKQLKRWENYLKEFKASLTPERKRENISNRNNTGNFQRNFNQHNGQRLQGNQVFGGGGQR